MVHRDIELLRYTASRLHITGVSTEESVDMIRRAKTDGLAITCSVTPLPPGAVGCPGSGAIIVFIRYRRHCALKRTGMALIQGLKDGTIDCIASHHRPQEWDAKAKEFEYAADGMGVQEITFNILWDTLKEYIAIDRLVEAMTIIPRDIFGLEVREIKKGNKASLTVFTTGGRYTLKDADVQSASIATIQMFIGKKLSGKVLGVINNGMFHLNK